MQSLKLLYGTASGLVGNQVTELSENVAFERYELGTTVVRGQTAHLRL